MTALWCVLFAFALAAGWVVRNVLVRTRLLRVLADGREYTGLQLRDEHGFGGDVYVHLRSLVREGVLTERHELVGARTRYLYRRKPLP